MQPGRRRVVNDDLKHDQYEEKESTIRTSLQSNDSQQQELKSEFALEGSSPRLVACNGDCGSELSIIINECVNGISINKGGYSKTISEAFWLYGYPLRQELINLLNKKELGNKKDFESIYKNLCDKSFCIQENDGHHIIIELFNKLKENNHIDILNELANKSCLEPNYSISQEVENYYKRRVQRIKQEISKRNERISEIVSTMNNENWEEKLKDLENYTKEKEKLKQSLPCGALRNQSSIINEKTYKQNIAQIKEKPEYKEMVKKNKPLSNQEILAIIIYCNFDQFCREMRKSHRDSQKGDTLHSCHWKTLFHHLCRGLYKIWTILHEGNKRFKKQYITQRRKLYQPNLLFSGMSGVIFSDKHQKEYPLYTVTSFSSSFSVAETFAKTTGPGVILTIQDAYQAIYDGDLIAASVKWISAYDGEDEFILLPTVLKNFRFIDKSKVSLHNDSAYMYPYDDKQIKIYEASEYEPMDLKPVIYDTSTRITPILSLLFGNHSGENYAQKRKKQFHAWVALLGGFLTWECHICHVTARLIEYTGCIVSATVECPSCRSKFLEFGGANPKQFKCHNPECTYIKHRDLQKVYDKDDPNKIDRNGYRCRKCDKQQRRAYLERICNDEQYLNKIADGVIARIEDEFKSNLNIDFSLNEEKERIKEFIVYVNNPDVDCIIIWDTIKEFKSLFAKILRNSPGFQKSIEEDKDEIIKVVLDMFNAPDWTKSVANIETMETIDNVTKSEVVQNVVETVNEEDVKTNVDDVVKDFKHGNVNEETVEKIVNIGTTVVNIIEEADEEDVEEVLQNAVNVFGRLFG